MLEQSSEEPKRKRKKVASNIEVLESERNVKTESSHIHNIPTLSLNYEELAKEDRFKNTGAVLNMDAKDFTFEYVRQSRLKQPILFTDQLKELGMRIPKLNTRQVVQKLSDGFLCFVTDNTIRQTTSMPIKDFVYEKFNKQDRDETLQMSAEIVDHEVLVSYFQAPTIIRKINWKNTVFPRQTLFLRKLSLEENFITMTMAGFCDPFDYFDTGETILIHVQSGCQYYFLIEPTSQNIEKHDSLNLNDVEFFGNQVDKCTCVCVKAGQTLIIPPIWIYSIYSPVDVVLYVHYFYHESSLGRQLEHKDKFMLTYQPLLWYFIAGIVKKACGRVYVRLISSSEYYNLLQQPPDPNRCYNVRPRKPEFYDLIDGHPIQRTFDAIDDNLEANNMPEVFNDDYLRSWDREFHINLSLLLSIFINLIKNMENARVGEGIRRPRHLLADFERVLQRFNNLQRREVSPIEIKQEAITIDELNEEETTQQQNDQSTLTVDHSSQSLVNLKIDDFLIRFDSNRNFKLFKASSSDSKVELKEIDNNEIPHFIDWIRTSYAGGFDEHVGELYSFANRYDIADLKTECINVFKESLNEDNFCQRLILAFQHTDQEFQQRVIEFTKQLSDWRDKLFNSEQWHEFIRQDKETSKIIWNRLSE